MAGSARYVDAPELKDTDRAAINVNFNAIDQALSNTVTKTGTQTISGAKTFGTITATSATITTLNVTDVVSAYQLGMKNRIINGDMRIDQRNAGAAVTVNSTTDQFPVDRFNGSGQSADGVFTLQQNSSVVPNGFRYSIKATVTTADASVGASQVYVVRQHIEGHNIGDAGFGTSWAKPVTLSFWVRSSLTGTFGGAFLNATASRAYPFTYTITSADTWEQKSVSFTADTTGVWETTTTLRGLSVVWAMGAGSSVVGTPDTWAAATYYGATGQTQVIGTLNATWYITGVQVELGSNATAFEFRPFGSELELCQRYYEKSYAIATVPGTATTTGALTYKFPVVDWEMPFSFAAAKRAAPTITFYNPNSGASGSWRDITAGSDKNMTTIAIGEWGFSWQNTNSITIGDRVQGHYTASTEL